MAYSSSFLLTHKRRRAGLRGGQATLERYGPERMRDWGKLGGRPRLPTLAEMESRQRSRQSNAEKRSNHGNRLPTTSLRRKLRELLNIDTGGAVVSGTSVLPERSE